MPKYRLRAQLVGGDKETQLDIPAGADNVRFDTYATLGAPAVLTQFEAHMHNRGKAMCLEAIYPVGSGNPRAGGAKTETLSCVDRFNFGWLRSYTYADDVQPLLPAGTILHIISWHNNSSSNKLNYDSSNWIRFREPDDIDDMAHMWLNYYNVTRTTTRLVSRRTSRKPQPTSSRNLRDVPGDAFIMNRHGRGCARSSRSRLPARR